MQCVKPRARTIRFGQLIVWRVCGGGTVRYDWTLDSALSAWYMTQPVRMVPL